MSKYVNAAPTPHAEKTNIAASPSRFLVFCLEIMALVALVSLPRLTALNQYVIVDEADRWRWAEGFVYALSRGDWAATLVGDGYPGIVPVWAESLWIFLEAGRRSLLAGQWIGEPGLYLIFHEWDRPAFLYQQRLPIVLLNIVLALAIIGVVWRLFGRWIALVSAILIALDPFYLSDSRVNRAEALITGLMTLSILALVFYYRYPQRRYIIISGILGGLSFLTKIQALAILPAIALIGLFIYGRRQYDPDSKGLKSYSLLLFGLLWVAAAGLTWLLLWPAMWVSPEETLTLVYNYTTRKVGAEGVNLFFMGQTYANADPGPIFYPFTFLMRITPLALIGLVVWFLYFRSQRAGSALPEVTPFMAKAEIPLVIFIVVYTLVMSAGSHKQDRYLLPIFLSVDILAAIGLVYGWDWLKNKKFTPQNEKPRLNSFVTYYFLPITLLLLQLVTVLPHHPYYYAYFNPLLGGGALAVHNMGVGWGEGMDQVGAYLAAKPNSRALVVASRFTHNMVGFKGEQISLLPDGRWTQADYIVLYIQQVQRRQEPSPAFIDYFQAKSPEKIVTIGGIDYAWIYPIPFTTPANPTISRVSDQAALAGYRWDEAGTLRLFWENLGLSPDQPLMARLHGGNASTNWVTCTPDAAFSSQTRTPGAYIESLCPLTPADLPPATYTVEIGLMSPAGNPETFPFPEGWHAATLTATGQLFDTPEQIRLEAVADDVLPPDARRLDRIYAGRLKLSAYQLDPPSPHPGQTVTLALYWQRVKEALAPLRLTVQLADSRSLPLGRLDTDLTPQSWFVGEVITTTYKFEVAADLAAPLAAQVEITLQNQTEVALPPTTLAGAALDPAVARFTIAPPQWPTGDKIVPVRAIWQNQINLAGYTLVPETVQPDESLMVNLFWQAGQPIAENYVVFIHLLDEAGQIKAQNDALPRAGAYPTLWWSPGLLIEDSHSLLLPPDLPAGRYQWVVGLYRLEDGLRLPLATGGDRFILESFELKDR